MIRRALFAALAVLVAVAAGPAGARGDDLRAALQARYDAIREAVDRHDADALGGIIAPDYVGIELDGSEVGAEQIIGALARTPSDPNKVRATTVESATLAPDGTASVRQRYDMTTRRAGEDGGIHDIRVFARSTDIWVLADGVWRIRRSVTTETSLWRDGALVAHDEAPPSAL